MKRPARWLIPLALCACVAAWWWSGPPTEPVLEGRQLSFWLKATSDGRDIARILPPQRMRLLGSSEVEWLAYTAEHGRVPLREGSRLHQFIADLRGLDFSAPSSQYDQRLAAIMLLGEMHAAARPAIPSLLHTLDGTNYDRIYASATALHRIGPKSWPAVEKQLQSGSHLSRCALLNTLWQRLDKKNEEVSVEDANKVFILLTRALQDSDPVICRNAATSLGEAITFAHYRDVSWSLVELGAAALWPLKDDSNYAGRYSRDRILRYYRQAKLESISRLTPLLTDSDEAKRNFAQAVLAQLDKY